MYEDWYSFWIMTDTTQNEFFTLNGITSWEVIKLF